MGMRKFKGTGSDAGIPAVNVTKKDPKLAAALSKMTASSHGTTRDAEGNRKTQLATTFAFRSILQKRARRNSDAAQILRLLPDIELSAQILVSSILSPKDMSTIDVLYMGPKNLVSPALSAALLARLKEHFDETYKIKNLLTEMVREPLFEKGSYPIAVIPENAIDDFINGDRSVSLEALRDFVDTEGKVRPMGILGPHTIETPRASPKGLALEGHLTNVTRDQAEKINVHVHYKDEGITDYRNYKEEEFLVVVDNPAILKIPKINARIKSKALMKQYGANNLNVPAMEEMEGLKREVKISMESIEGGLVSDHRVEQAIFRTRQYQTDPIATMKKPHELKRRSVGSPLIMKLPSESVIPVHVPGNLKQHIGYFIVLDEEGNPVEVPDGEETYQGLGANNTTAGNSLASNLIRKVETNLGGTSGSFDPANAAHMDFASKVYADMVERDFISRVKNGVYASNAALAKNEEVYRIMLSRVLARKYTQVLYLPVEFMTYIAFKYGDDGVGRSLLDDTAMVNMLRATMLFADVMASVKNSIGRTKVMANIPEHDPNPMKTLERAQDEIVRSRMLGLPLGVSNTADIMEFIQRAGYEWEIGGTKGLPDLRFEFTQTNTSYAKPDTELRDAMRKASIMAFGLSPETVDNGFNTEFATTAVHNNLLLAKRVMLAQDILTPQVSEHLRKVAMNTEDLVQDLKKLLEDDVKGIRLELDDTGEIHADQLSEELKDKIRVQRTLQEFINGFYIELPRPTSVTLETQLADLKTYSDGLDEALNAYISSEFFTASTAGDLSSEADVIKGLIKSYYVRKWLADKGIMTELSNLTGVDEDGEPVLKLADEMTDHVKGLVRSGVMALAKFSPMVQAANKDMAAMKIEPSAGGGMGGGGGGSDFGGGGGDFGGGGDDFDFGDDFSFDDAGGDENNPDGNKDNQQDGDQNDPNADVTIPSDADAQANEKPAADNGPA